MRAIGVPERRACRVLGQHRSTQRKIPCGREDEAALTADIVALATRYGRYGYRRIAALLRSAGWLVNPKRVERIWRREGLKVPVRQPKRGRLWLTDGSCKVRRYKEFLDGAASWSRVERIVARVEVGAQGADTRFIVTNLAGGKAKALYEDVYCRRGAAENHIKSWKTHLGADRTSCSSATANQFRLFLHAGAYWLMWGLRAAMPKRSSFALAQFDTLRLRLIKIAARVVEMKTRIRLHLPKSYPDQAILRVVLDRIPRLVT